jgi:ankyrin repeat protein
VCSTTVSNHDVKRALFALLVLMASTACDPGPLPAPSRPHPGLLTHAAGKQDSFTSSSRVPLPLDVAIQADRIDEVRTLLASGADPNARWGALGDDLPLRDALVPYRASSSSIVQLLLEHGANPNAAWCPPGSRNLSEFGPPPCTTASALTPLQAAAMVDSRDIVGLLVAAGADPRPRNYTGSSALDYVDDEVAFEMISAALFPELSTRDRVALAWLDALPADVTGARTSVMERALTRPGWARPPAIADSGDWQDGVVQTETRIINRVRTLLRLGVDVNARVDNGLTPLSIALHHRSIRVAEVLLDHGANPNQRFCEFELGTVRKPLDCNVDNGMTPLMWAAGAGEFDIVELLLEFGADSNLKDWEQRTALHYATTRKIWTRLERY